jgi:hypothetical protein
MQSETAFQIAGFEELFAGIRYWRISHLMGVRDLRHRYARSKGPGKGVCANFLSLANDPKINAGYFGFSDQDTQTSFDTL